MPRVKKKSKKALEDELARASEDQERRERQERLQEAEAAHLREHQDRLASELDALNKADEAERLQEESSIVSTMKGDRKGCLEHEQRILQDQVDWQKWVSCTSRPNVAFENEITTYMTMVREEKTCSMEAAREKCNESEDIVGDLMELYCKACEDGDRARQEWCMRYIHEIRTLEVDLIDEATAHLLQHIEDQDKIQQSQVYLQWGGPADEIKVGFWGHLQSKGFRAKQIEHSKIQVSLDLPKSIALQSLGHCIGVRTLYTGYDSVNGKDPSQMPVGGMIRVDLLSIPPFSKRVKGWTIRQIPPPGQELTRLPYPNNEHTGTTAIAVQPCKIEYKVPPNLLVRKSPQISFWDPQLEKWMTDHITDIAWEPEVRKISFYSQRLAAFSITQERHLDLPYQWWSLKPVQPNIVELTVQAARYELRFIISEAGLRLKGPELPELRDIMYTYCEPEGDKEGSGSPTESTQHLLREPRIKSPATLLCELRQCGMNLMPEDGDAEFLEGYTPKMTETQARAYSDLSEIAACYDVASSKHNKALVREQALVRIRHNPHFEECDPLDPDCDTDYMSVMFFPDKACFVQSLEGTEPCNEKLLAGHLTHASLYLCFQKHPTPSPNHDEQLQKLEVNCANVRFIEAVRQTMALMRLLCFV